MPGRTRFSASTAVEIHYCVPCGHLPRAIDLQRTLLETLGQDLERVCLKTGDGGVFTVSVDDERVFDHREEGLDEAAVLDRVAQRASAAQ